jgi:hypothetical protein
MALTISSDLPLSGQPDSRDPVLLAGTLAASMEQLARIAVAACAADGAVVALLGADRRSFQAGRTTPQWMAHDSGILIRTGLIAAAIEQGGTLVMTEGGGAAQRSRAGCSRVAGPEPRFRHAREMARCRRNGGLDHGAPWDAGNW